jgi:hypothetical protein
MMFISNFVKDEELMYVISMFITESRIKQQRPYFRLISHIRTSSKLEETRVGLVSVKRVYCWVRIVIILFDEM